MRPDGAPRVPPGPSRWSTLSLLSRMARDRLEVMTWASARYGDAVRLRLGPKTLNFFNNPEHAKYVLADNAGNYLKGIGLVHARRALGDGLLTSEGELWKTQRKTIQPTFQPRRISKQAGTIAEEAAAMVDRLRARADSGPVDVRHEMTELTLGILGRTLLDADLTEFQSIGESFEHVQDQAIFEMMSLSTVPHWIPLPGQLRFRRAQRDLQHVVDTLVADKAPVSAERDDVVSRLIEATKSESDPQVRRTRIRDEMNTLLLAGHETTASTLSWTFYLLDKHPEVAERVHAEAVEVLGDRLPTHDDLKKLSYTTMVVQEVMRLYSPVWIIPRIAREADTIGGFHVKAGADVLICPYTLHRHPDYWDHPTKFDPERFLPENVAGRPRYAYIPFGAGPRFCIGNTLGTMEAIFVIALIARELRLSLDPDHKVVGEPMLTLRISGELPMHITKRD
ncbi:MAG TPA: cytochrome P450 [Actinophytocola sp.]|uniref:cytochrome P450 n=1 Tax=Actinophytocola sp. TaxID=1872138 RepID=UPI002DFE2E24|nr:cytochrome P450 [Actinophytocola sp.]